MRKRITFGIVDNGSFPTDTKNTEFVVEDTEDNLTFGRFKFERDSMFGSPTEERGQFVYREDDGLLGVVTEGDQPKPETIFRLINEDKNVSLHVSEPEYPPEASHKFFETYGFNGYTTDFREEHRSNKFGLQSEPPTWVSPEEIAEERAMHSQKNRMSDDLVDEITEELMEKGYYVSNMDMNLSENSPNVRFSNPLQFSGIKNEEFNRETLKLIVKRATELLENNVKSVEEVLKE